MERGELYYSPTKNHLRGGAFILIFCGKGNRHYNIKYNVGEDNRTRFTVGLVKGKRELAAYLKQKGFKKVTNLITVLDQIAGEL